MRTKPTKKSPKILSYISLAVDYIVAAFMFLMAVLLVFGWPLLKLIALLKFIFS